MLGYQGVTPGYPAATLSYQGVTPGYPAATPSHPGISYPGIPNAKSYYLKWRLALTAF
jgi:hypothetical protein